MLQGHCHPKKRVFFWHGSDSGWVIFICLVRTTLRTECFPPLPSSLCVSPTLFINTTLDFKLPRSTAIGGTGMKGQVYWRTHSRVCVFPESGKKVSSQLSFCSPVPSLVFGVCRDTMWSSHNHITENVPLICRLAVREGFSPWGPQAILSLLGAMQALPHCTQPQPRRLLVHLFSNPGSADKHTCWERYSEGTALSCLVLSRKASVKGTHKGYIEWWVAGAQVLKVRDSPQAAPRTRNRPQWRHHHSLLIPDRSLQLDGRITSCSKEEEVFPSLGDKLLWSLKSFL